MRTKKTTPEPAPEFRDLLRRNGLTLSTLERGAGLGRNDAWRYAAGLRSPRLSTVVRMSQAIGVGVDVVVRSLVDARERYLSERERKARLDEAIRRAYLPDQSFAG